MRLKAWLAHKKQFFKQRTICAAYEKDGEKHLVIGENGWRGVKWSRSFIVEREESHSENLEAANFVKVHSKL